MNPFQTLSALRKTYPTPMSNDQLGELLNSTAWAHREDGYGQLEKTTGANCRQPQTGILVSRDILCLQVGRELVLYDCLIDAEGLAKPVWSKKKGTLSDLTRFVAPVDPGVVVPPRPPDPPPAETVPYPGDATGVAIGEILFADYATAGQDPNPGMGTWFMRTCWDVANPPYLTVDESIAKHRAEWCAILGIAP
jgi:hypothetical protein